METEKKLGKILSIKFGLGGYNDCQIGLFVTLGTSEWGVGAQKASHDHNLIKWSPSCKWNEEDRHHSHVDVMKYVSDLLKDAKVNDVSDLKGKPVEVTLNESRMLDSWRILTEVI
jgi:hypothetical protein